ncbi:MAG: MBL fold metallo-hydrolase [Candidatus Hodarchaeales archaeon]|jgi:ribonuclease BN (tRNA processing enzyme)/isopentenyl phosphate kinase
MRKQPITLIKLGGSLITYKTDTHRIDQYLDQIDLFLRGSGSLEELTKKISDLINFHRLNEIYKVLSAFIVQNPKKKVVLIHGAGSIGHSLVLHLLKNHSDLQSVYPVIKLAVAIQNQIVVSTAIRHGINAISFPSHPILTGIYSETVSTKKADSPDLTVFEKIITETNAIPIFYGDVGHTPSGWKVFSGDIYPAALTRCLKVTRLDSVIFLTNIEGKLTGIYTKDPSFNDAEYIARIEVDIDNVTCFNSNNKIISFQGGKINGDFDVTDAMGGKLRNLIELANAYTECWVVGLNEFNQALNGVNVGTRIIPKRTSQANVTFLGTGDAFGSGGGKSASTFVEIGTQGILLDCGPHILSTLKQSGRSTNDIDMVLITHFHGDHCNGVPYLLLEASILQQRKKPLVIVGPPNIDGKVKKLFSLLYETIAEKGLPFSCEFLTLTPSTSSLKVKDINIKAFKMNHTPEAQGYRIETKNVSIAYSGDSGWTDELIPLIKDTQLAILECNFFNIELEIHLNYHQVKNLHSHTDRLALIHLGSELLDQLPLLEEDSNVFFPLEGQEIWI